MTVSSDVPNNQGFEALIAEGDEKLVWVAPTAPLTFQFKWENVVFSGHISNGGENHRLLLLGDMGPLPFSAEDPSFRERLMKLVRWQPEKDHARFVLEPKRQHIYLMIDDVLQGELSGIQMIASTTQLLFHIRPYLELARDVGWKPVVERSDEVINFIDTPEKPKSEE